MQFCIYVMYVSTFFSHLGYYSNQARPFLSWVYRNPVFLTKSARSVEMFVDSVNVKISEHLYHINVEYKIV